MTTMPAPRSFGCGATYTSRISCLLACFWAISPLLDGASFEHKHPGDFIFQFAPALMIGFFSRALPRWAGQPVSPRFALEALAICSGITLILRGIGNTNLQIASAFITSALALVVCFQALTRRGRRIAYVAFLLALYACAAILHAGAIMPTPRFGLGALILLCSELGDRICSAQLSAIAQDPIEPPRSSTFIVPLQVRRLTRLAAVAFWLLNDHVALSGGVATLAGLSHLIGLRPWLSWRHSGVAILCLGVLWMQIGFAFLAASEYWPAAEILAIHAWGVGGLGSLAAGIMTSMVRRQLAQPFSSSATTNLAYLSGTVAACCRLIGATGLWNTDLFLWAAKLAWGCCFGLCGVFLLRAFATSPIAVSDFHEPRSLETAAPESFPPTTHGS